MSISTRGLSRNSGTQELSLEIVKNRIKVSIFQLTILSIDRSITVLPSSNSKIIQKLKTKRREAKFSIIVSHFQLKRENLNGSHLRCIGLQFLISVQICFVIWLSAFVLSYPSILVTKLDSIKSGDYSKSICTEEWPSGYPSSDFRSV